MNDDVTDFTPDEGDFLPELWVDGEWNGSNGGRGGWDYDHDRRQWKLPPGPTKYVYWLLARPGNRVPPTKQAFARSVGVHVDSLKRWRRDERFQRVLEREAKSAWRDPELVNDVLDAMFEAAKKGNVQAAKLWMEATGLKAASPGGSQRPWSDPGDTSGAVDRSESEKSLDELFAELESLKKQAAAGG